MQEAKWVAVSAWPRMLPLRSSSGTPPQIGHAWAMRLGCVFLSCLLPSVALNHQLRLVLPPTGFKRLWRERG